jgi:hypothetical protein
VLSSAGSDAKADRIKFEQEEGYIVCGIHGCLLKDRHPGDCLFDLQPSKRRRRSSGSVATPMAAHTSHRGGTPQTKAEPFAKRARAEPAATTPASATEPEKREKEPAASAPPGTPAAPAPAKEPGAAPEAKPTMMLTPKNQPCAGGPTTAATATAAAPAMRTGFEADVLHLHPHVNIACPARLVEAARLACAARVGRAMLRVPQQLQPTDAAEAYQMLDALTGMCTRLHGPVVGATVGGSGPSGPLCAPLFSNRLCAQRDSNAQLSPTPAPLRRCLLSPSRPG